MKDTKNFYDHFAQSKPTTIGDKLVNYIFRKLFNRLNIKKSDRVLEIGPGRGVFADICLENGVEYWAIEPNEKMAESLEKRGVKIIRSTVPPIPALPVKFNAVVMIHVLEHMDTMTAALDTARGINGLLENGGKFLICSPDFLGIGKYFFLGDFSHNYVTSYRRLHQLLISAGFKKISGYYTSGPFTGLPGFIISFLARCLPFVWLGSLIPDNKIILKAYEAQITFLRNIVVIAEKED
jgi:ubiquinone/menaquinone biosynthesis C-methylase UbiE